MEETSWVEVPFDELCIFRTSDKAWAITYGFFSDQRDRFCRFIPKSLSAMDKEKCIARMPEWLAKQKGLKDVGQQRDISELEKQGGRTFTVFERLAKQGVSHRYSTPRPSDKIDVRSEWTSPPDRDDGSDG